MYHDRASGCIVRVLISQGGDHDGHEKDETNHPSRKKLHPSYDNLSPISILNVDVIILSYLALILRFSRAISN